MTESEWQIVPRKIGEDGPLVEFGPLPDDPSRRKLAFPQTFTREVLRLTQDAMLTLRLGMSFDGERLQVKELTVKSASPSLRAKDVNDIDLQRIVRGIGQQVAIDLDRWPTTVRTREERLSTGFMLQDIEDVARIYWFENAIWGAPRKALMESWGVSRSTAASWIRRAAVVYVMPPSRAAALADEAFKEFGV